MLDSKQFEFEICLRPEEPTYRFQVKNQVKANPIFWGELNYKLSEQ